MLSCIDRFLFIIYWDNHFQVMHQVILPAITSYHFSILLRFGEVPCVRCPFKFESLCLEAEYICV